MNPILIKESLRFWENFVRIFLLAFLCTPTLSAFADNLLANAAALENKVVSIKAEQPKEEPSEEAEEAEEEDFDLILEEEDVAETTHDSTPKTKTSEIKQKTVQEVDSETSTTLSNETVTEEPVNDDETENSDAVDEEAKVADEAEVTDEVKVSEEVEVPDEMEAKEETSASESAETSVSSDSVTPNTSEETTQDSSFVPTESSTSEDHSETKSEVSESVIQNLREDSIVRAIRSARPAVVNIRGEKVLKSVPYNASGSEATNDSQHVNGMGTGVLFDPRGYIVTNFHVVDGIQEIHVTTADTKTYVAQVLARDKETDLAIIKIDALAGEVFQTLKFGESTDLMSGETVIAVGNAYGYEHTVTKGIISALHRSVQVSDVQFYQDLIQTDASINPGNSGGPLLNVNGEMIGINVAVRAGAQGIGFAIPVNHAMEVVAKMVESYIGETNWHGIQFVNLPVGSSTGAVVQGVESNSPAATIGLRTGDVILAVNNQPIRHELDFACSLLELKRGETIRLTVSRSEKKATVKLALGAVATSNRVASEYTPEIQGRPAFDARKLTNEELVWKELGVLTSVVPGSKIHLSGQKKYNGGLLVQNVRTNSPAARQGIQNGDILLGILRWETLSLDNLIFVLNQPELIQNEQIKFLIARNGKVMLGHFVAADFHSGTAFAAAAVASPNYK